MGDIISLESYKTDSDLQLLSKQIADSIGPQTFCLGELQLIAGNEILSTKIVTKALNVATIKDVLPCELIEDTNHMSQLCEKMPQLEKAKAKGIEILDILNKYDNVPFKVLKFILEISDVYLQIILAKEYEGIGELELLLLIKTALITRGYDFGTVEDYSRVFSDRVSACVM